MWKHVRLGVSAPFMPEIIVPYGSLSCPALTKGWYPSLAHAEPAAKWNATWLILPVVICLSQRLSHACSGLHHRDTLAVLIRNGTWTLPTANSRHHHLDPLLLSWLANFDFPTLHAEPDLLLWNGIDARKTKTWQIWDAIRFRAEKVSWFQGIWHRLRVNRRTTAKAFAKDVFINQERKLGARRRSDTVLVSTINDADQGSVDVAFRTPLAPYEKSKFLGSGGSMVARLKLKGIDGRAPPGVEPAA
ncbi:hypothetical protein AgCh_010834 [Apium graveolens]